MPATNGSERAAIYVRLSRETETSSSVERQREDCERLVEERGYRYSPDHDLYVDSDLSAYDESKGRPEFERLMRHLDDYEALVVWKLDRMYRRFDGATRVLARLQEANAELVSVTESLDTTTPTGKAIAGFIAAQAETESANTSKRVASAAKWRRKHGYWHGGLIPFGYSKLATPDGTKLVRDEDEARVLQEAAERVLAGDSVYGIANDLTERGAPSSGRTEGWSLQSLKFALRNPVMTGYQSTRDEDGERRIVHRDGEPVYVVEGEPVLDDETWRKVTDVFDRRKGTRPSRPNRTLLSGLVECGECGAPMHGNRSSNQYQCKTRWVNDDRECPGNTASLSALDEYLTGVAKGMLVEALEGGADAERQASDAGTGPLVDRLTHLETLEAQQENELDRLLLEEGRDYEDRAVRRHQKRMQRTRDERDEVKAELDRIRQGQHVGELRDLLGSDPVETFDSFDPDDKRDALTLLLDRVEVSKASRRSSVFDTDRAKPVPRT